MAFVVEAEKEAFHIDDLLDFSCEDIGGPIVGAGELELSGVTVESCCEASISSSEILETAVSLDVDKTDLCVPCDDLADLEWLSSFVEDSFAAVESFPEVSSSAYGSFPSALGERTPKLYQQSSPVSVLESSPASSELVSAVPGRARSKRSRTGVRIWTSKILPSTSSFESEDDSTVDDDEEEDEEELYEDDDDEDEDSSSQSSKRSSSGGRKKSRQENTTNALQAQPQQVWRCLHCQTQRTPQWRTGPMGPKTLCNACGVRYKSGRLLPEYRPAGSPTYVASKHSHSHKKVIEMRRERELKAQKRTPSPSPSPSPPMEFSQCLTSNSVRLL